MTRPLSMEAVAALADLAGYELAADDARRVASAIGPALAAFSDVEATLPFEAEPARFAFVQTRGGQRT